MNEKVFEISRKLFEFLSKRKKKVGTSLANQSKFGVVKLTISKNLVFTFYS